MPYSQFTTLAKAKAAFNLTTIEGVRFLPDVQPINPSTTLLEFLRDNLTWAVAVGSEKAMSEVAVAPVLLEVRKICQSRNQPLSVFSGIDFTVDLEAGLNGYCDYLISRSAEQMDIEAPAIVLVEAKKADLKTGLGQCVAEMVAAQRFNHEAGKPVAVIYGVVTSGIQWQFLKLEDRVVTIDLNIYPMPPVDQILGLLVWMGTSEN